MTESEDYCDPGAGVFTPGCTQHLPSGESTSAKLRRVEQELSEVREALAIAQGRAARLGDIALERRMERNNAWRERDEAQAAATIARSELADERDRSAREINSMLAVEAELTSARTELDARRNLGVELEATRTALAHSDGLIRDLTAELASAREDMRIKALMVANLNHRLTAAGQELERLQPIVDAARAYVTHPDSGDAEAVRRYRALSELFYPDEQGEDHARNR